MNTEALVGLAKRSDAIIEMVAAVGDTVLDSTPLLRVFGARQTIDERKLTTTIEHHFFISTNGL